MTVENPPQLEPLAYHHPPELNVERVRQPTAVQEARRARLRRFNRLVVYLPLTLVALGWIALFLGLLWLSVVGEWFAMDTNQTYFRKLFSGIADIVTMLALAPMLLLCALPIAGAVALVGYRRQRRAETAARGPSLPLFWRVENVIVDVHDRASVLLPRLARPVINAHATAAYVKRFLNEMKRIIKQEISRNGDDR